MGPVPPVGVERRVKAGSPLACGASCTPTRDGVAGSQSVGGWRGFFVGAAKLPRELSTKVPNLQSCSNLLGYLFPF